MKKREKKINFTRMQNGNNQKDNDDIKYSSKLYKQLNTLYVVYIRLRQYEANAKR